jgi:hypothetical protein
MEDDFIISRYIRENAIADGVLIDITEQAKQTGIRCVAYLGTAAWNQ